MNTFVAQYPGIVVALLGLMGTVISILIIIIGWFLRRTIQSIDNLARAITELRVDMADDKARIKILENE